MAVSISLLTQGFSTVAGPWNTDSISPTPGSVIFVGCVVSTVTGDADIATGSGLSLTYDYLRDRQFQLTTTEYRRRLTVMHAAAGESPGSGAITLTAAAGGGGAAWAVVQANSDPGNNGLDGIVQHVGTDHTGLSTNLITATLAALADAANATLAFFGAAVNNTFTTGETELADTGGGGAGKQLAASWAQPGVIAMDATHATSFADLAAIALELKEAAGGAGRIMRPAGGIGTGGMQSMSGGMQGRSRIVVPANFHAFRARGARPNLRV